MQKTNSGLLERISSYKYFRLGVVILCMAAVPLLWFGLSSTRSIDKIFGRYSIKSFGFLLISTYLAFWGIYFGLSRNPLRSKLANFILASIAFMFAYGLLEMPAVFGILDYRVIFSPSQGAVFTQIKPWDDPRNRFDPELMHLRRPMSRIEGDTSGDLVYWLGITTPKKYHIDAQYDQNGFRNDQNFTNAPVIAIGDSFLEAGLVPFNDLLTTRLGQLTNLSVANLGQSGYGPQQELIVLRRYGLNLQPRVVLWFFFEGNDLLDITRYEDFEKNLDEILKENKSLKQRSFTYNALSFLVKLTEPKTQPSGAEAEKRSCTPKNPAITFEGNTLYFAYAGGPISDEGRQQLQETERILTEANQLSTSQGAQFVLVYVPTKFRVYHALCEFPADGYGRQWEVNDLPKQLNDWADKNNVPYIDLTPSLYQAASQGVQVFFSDDGHWNGEGNQVAATTIFDYLAQQGWLKNNTISQP